MPPAGRFSFPQGETTMGENRPPAFPARAAVAALTMVTAGPAVTPAVSDSSAGSPPGVAAWLEGDAPQAVLDLASRTDREGVVNRAVATLYAGDAAAAERELAALRPREPRWTPALRWLARARAAAGSPGLEETLQALLADRGADSRDFLWIGRLRLDAGEAEAARASLREAVAREEDLYLGCLWLGDAEDALGHAGPAREAWLRARELHAGGDVLFRLGESSLRAGREDEGRRWLEEALATPEGRRREGEIRRLLPGLVAPPVALDLAPPLRPGERLRYSARYLFFRFATVEIENQGFTELRGRRVARVVFSVRSNPGFPLLTIDSRFESFIAEDGSVLAHRNTSRDSTQDRRAAAYDMDPATGQCVVRQVVEGLFGFDRFPLAPLGQDGVSVLQLARALVRAPARVSVLTAVDGTWKGTELRAVAAERLRWAGREVEAVKVEAVGRYRGPAGLSGRVRAWISRDGRAVPYKAAIKIALGSVVLSLRDDSPEAADD
jgi:tetratricopeptide (TPR) repeat protein